MNLKMLKAAVAGLVLTVCSTANAGLITVSELVNQTTDGQNFTFSFNINDYFAGTSSTLQLIAQGDFNDGAGSNESISIFIEGVSFGNFGHNSVQAYNVVNYTSGVDNFNAYEFSLDFLLNAATTGSMLQDNILDIVIDFGAGVRPACGWSGTDNCIENSGVAPFAAVNYTYSNSAEVPEPTTLALFGLAVLGFAARRSKQK